MQREKYVTRLKIHYEAYSECIEVLRMMSAPEEFQKDTWTKEVNILADHLEKKVRNLLHKIQTVK